MSTEWPLWEVFIRGQHGLSHRHVGSLHAPDAEMAISVQVASVRSVVFIEYRWAVMRFAIDVARW